MCVFLKSANSISQTPNSTYACWSSTLNASTSTGSCDGARDADDPLEQHLCAFWQWFAGNLQRDIDASYDAVCQIENSDDGSLRTLTADEWRTYAPSSGESLNLNLHLHLVTQLFAAFSIIKKHPNKSHCCGVISEHNNYLQNGLLFSALSSNYC